MTNIVYLTNHITNSITNHYIQVQSDLFFQVFGPALIGLIVGIIVGIITFYITYYKAKFDARRTQSLVGYIVIESFIEDVRNGIKILEFSRRGQIPTESWSGINSVSDDLLERVICISKNKRINKNDEFHPSKIRKHLKHYFSFICGNFNNRLDESASTQILYQESSKKILTMLESIRDLLLKNSKKRFPK